MPAKKKTAPVKLTANPRGSARVSKKPPLTPAQLKQIDAYWRASNYLTACQLYLLDNPLLERPLTAADLKQTIADECPTHPKAKEAIIKATDTDSAVTGFSRNNAVRCLKNEFTKEYLEKECSGAPQQELNDFATGTNRLGAVEGDIVHGAVLVGQSLNVLNDILPCAEVMERLIAEARDTLANAKNIVL